MAVTLLLVAGVAWFVTRPSGKPTTSPAASTSPSPSFPCKLEAPSIASGPATLTTPDWKVSVKESRSAAGIPGIGGGTFFAETGKVFVVGGLTFRRLGSAHATIRSDDISIVCMGGGGVTPGYWSSDGKGYCFPCSFDFTSGSRSMSIWFAFKVDGPRAAFPFAVDYRGFGPMPLVPTPSPP